MATILDKQINLQQQSSHIYHASYHDDWAVGPSVHGGTLAAILHVAAKRHMATTLSPQNQPDILTMHFEFLRMSAHESFIITITDLKAGRGTCTLQLHMTQPHSKPNQPTVIATATSINFEIPFGPGCKTDWTFLPSAPPKPDFQKISAHQSDMNWIPFFIDGEVMPFTRRMMQLSPRDGFHTEGLGDWWSRFTSNNIDSTHLTVITDVIASMSDTLLRSGGIFDGHAIHAQSKIWADQNPGKLARITNTVAEALKTATWVSTLTLDIEYKKRLPKQGLEWLFVRVLTREMKDGRMDVEVSICDEDMQLVCVARQIIIVMASQRTFNKRKSKKSSEKVNEGGGSKL